MSLCAGVNIMHGVCVCALYRLNTGPAGGKGRGGAAGSGNKQVGGRGGGRVAAPQASAPLTPEELARRREMMAQAAEARAKALQQATQSQRLY